MEFPYALKDAEKCIELCPTFGAMIWIVYFLQVAVKGYTRKAICHFYMKEYHKALESYDKGLKIGWFLLYIHDETSLYSELGVALFFFF